MPSTATAGGYYKWRQKEKYFPVTSRTVPAGLYVIWAESMLGTFQQPMNLILSTIQSQLISVYLKELLVLAKSLKAHFKHMQYVLAVVNDVFH